MSRLRLNNMAVNPSPPATGKKELFIGANGKLQQIDETGATTPCTPLLTTKGDLEVFTTQPTRLPVGADGAGLEADSTASSGLSWVLTKYKLIRVIALLQGTTSYVPTVGTRALYVECSGAGGSGGGTSTANASASTGGGGGGGAFSSDWSTTVKASYVVSIGAGGAAAAAGLVGNAGGDTTFDSPSICTAKGGSGGTAGGTAAATVLFILGGAGGLATAGVGDIAWNGAAGGRGIRLSGVIGSSGKGGDGPLGGGGGGLEKIAQGAGNPGLSFGAGGSGGLTLNNGGTTSGGAGFNGIIRVWEFG